MEWMTRMNAAVAYLEAHLDEEIDLREAGRLAGCSAYHFQRVFAYMANVTLGEYLRRRRLTRAAFDLQQGGDRVIDVALRYGYDSPTAFTRAFQALHGMTPSEARQPGAAFVAYAPLSFQISIQGGSAMKYRIEQKEAFRAVGLKLETTTDGGRNESDVPAFWGQVAQQGKIGEIAALIDKEPAGVLGVCVGSFQTVDTFAYYIAAATDKPIPMGMEEVTIPACTWAIFECVGPMPHAIQDMQRRVVTEWLPTSGYDYADAPDIEVYDAGDNSSPTYRSWIWLPIVKK